MKINITLNHNYNEKVCNETKSEKMSPTVCKEEGNSTITRNCDSSSFSANALKYLKGNSKITVSSGGDILEANQNTDTNKISIRFGDSAVLSRTVKRGYVEIDGKRITLSDEIKKKLTETDKTAQKARETAFAYYNLRHNMAVSKQQSQALKNKMDKDIQAFSISAKMSKGSVVSPKEESVLLKSDPQMYLMAKIAQQMAKSHKKEYDYIKTENKVGNDNTPKEFTSYKVSFDIDISSESAIGSSVSIEEVKISV
ncbi:MAG: hypothetical protein IJA12_07735 [Oscillospiraceae bacterium]|nr:hypothetical protein [Oscillospiraceae bacterium]